MDTKIIRILLFIFLCIPFRIFLVYIAKYKQKYLKFLSFFAIIIGIGFIYFYFSGTRKIGLETFGELIWWNDLRLVHAFNFLTFSILTYFKPNIAFLPLLFDVIIGFNSWILYTLLFS